MDYVGNMVVYFVVVGFELKIFREVFEWGVSVYVRNWVNNMLFYLVEKMVVSGMMLKSEECVGLLKEVGGYLWLENEESMVNSWRGFVGGRENGNGVNVKLVEEKLILEVEVFFFGDLESFFWGGVMEKVC